MKQLQEILSWRRSLAHKAETRLSQAHSWLVRVAEHIGRPIWIPHKARWKSSQSRQNRATFLSNSKNPVISLF